MIDVLQQNSEEALILLQKNDDIRFTRHKWTIPFNTSHNELHVVKTRYHKQFLWSQLSTLVLSLSIIPRHLCLVTGCLMCSCYMRMSTYMYLVCFWIMLHTAILHIYGMQAIWTFSDHFGIVTLLFFCFLDSYSSRNVSLVRSSWAAVILHEKPVILIIVFFDK